MRHSDTITFDQRPHYWIDRNLGTQEENLCRIFCELGSMKISLQPLFSKANILKFQNLNKKYLKIVFFKNNYHRWIMNDILVDMTDGTRMEVI